LILACPICPHIGLDHSVPPVQPFGVNGSEAAQGGGAFNAPPEESGAGQGVRTTSGTTDNAKRVNPERICDFGDIAGYMADGAAVLPV
jgi:hypothetical protein